LFALVPNSDFSSPGDVESRDHKRSKCRTGPSPTRSADLSGVLNALGLTPQQKIALREAWGSSPPVKKADDRDCTFLRPDASFLSPARTHESSNTAYINGVYQQSHCELDFARDKFNTAGKTLAYTKGRIDYQKYLINTAGRECAKVDDQIAQLTAQRDILHDSKVDKEEAVAQMICMEQIQMQQEEEAGIELDAEKKRHAGVKFRFKFITGAFVAKNEEIFASYSSMELRQVFGFKRNSTIEHLNIKDMLSIFKELNAGGHPMKKDLKDRMKWTTVDWEIEFEEGGNGNGTDAKRAWFKSKLLDIFDLEESPELQY